MRYAARPAYDNISAINMKYDSRAIQWQLVRAPCARVLGPSAVLCVDGADWSRQQHMSQRRRRPTQRPHRNMFPTAYASQQQQLGDRTDTVDSDFDV